MAEFRVSDQELQDAIGRVKEALEADRAAGRPTDRDSMNGHVLDVLQEQLKTRLNALDIQRSQRAGQLRTARMADDDEEVKRIQALEPIPDPSPQEITAERNRLQRQAMQVLAPIFLVQGNQSAVPATAPPTPDTIIRAAPQLKANPSPSPLKPVIQPGGIVLPSHEIPGAAEATLVLGAGLAIVALWPQVKSWTTQTVWLGAPTKVPLPTSGILSMVLFVGALVLAASLSPDLAQVTLWLVLALWVVLLVQHPDIVTTVAGFFSQGTATVGPEPGPAIERGVPIKEH